MFENISFSEFKLPHSITPQDISLERMKELKEQARYDLSVPDVLLAQGDRQFEELPPNLRHCDFCLNGKTQSFSRPPVSNFALENLYYMENFCISHCAQGFFTRRTLYSSYLIIYTYEGEGVLEYEGKKYRLRENDGFFIDCSRPQYYAAPKGRWVHGVLHFNGKLVPQLFRQFLENGSVVFHQPLSGFYQSHLEELLSIYSNSQPYRDWQASNCLGAILTDLLVSSLRTSEKSAAIPENMQYLIRYMEAHYNQPMNLDYLSRFSGISRSCLTREFKKYTGFSPNDYLIQLRIEQAKKLLRSTTLPANKISHIVGIQDINNFTNLFRKKTGLTPGNYRKRQQMLTSG